jgi:protein gp37
MAKRLAAMARADVGSGRNPGRKANYATVVNAKGRWNGHVYLDQQAIDEPLSWRLPRIIFVNSMSDLFHRQVPTAFIQSVFRVMNHCPQHTFQILTKRPERTAKLSSELIWTPNIWMGTSVEDRSVTYRVGSLHNTGAAVKFLSIEPLLGPMPDLDLAGVDWVIVGGESGPGARPIQENWVRQIRDACLKHEVPFFFKQWGGTNKKRNGRLLDGRTWDEMPQSSSR